MLTVYNDLTRQKQAFVPIHPGQVRMYVCGMTVYDYCHLGHARVMVVFDVVYRYLRSLGYDVIYVRNITDIDDKIIKRANENGEPFHALTERFIAAMREDAAALGVLAPDLRAEGDRSHWRDRGDDRAADRQRARLRAQTTATSTTPSAASRVTASCRASRSRTSRPVRGSSRESRSATRWTSRCGRPRSRASRHGTRPGARGGPGWHIECSAMSTAALGNHFDIHGGGADLTFPHHENEIAQSEGATHEPFVNYWLHNGFVRINDEKMSKSLGNFFTVREILERYRPEEVRYFILTSQYRSPLNYDEDHLLNARGALTRLYTALRGVPPAAPDSGTELTQRFLAAMDDDFNTPEALAVLFDLVREVNRLRRESDAAAAPLAAELRRLGGVLGILQEDPEAFLKAAEPGSAGLSDAEIESLIAQRLAARKAKNWAEADRIRDALKAKGVLLEDGPGGTTWRRG